MTGEHLSQCLPVKHSAQWLVGTQYSARWALCIEHIVYCEHYLPFEYPTQRLPCEHSAYYLVNIQCRACILNTLHRAWWSLSTVNTWWGLSTVPSWWVLSTELDDNSAQCLKNTQHSACLVSTQHSNFWAISKLPNGETSAQCQLCENLAQCGLISTQHIA